MHNALRLVELGRTCCLSCQGLRPAVMLFLFFFGSQSAPPLQLKAIQQIRLLKPPIATAVPESTLLGTTCRHCSGE